jgi:hypothetical protein
LEILTIEEPKGVFSSAQTCGVIAHLATLGIGAQRMSQQMVFGERQIPRMDRRTRLLGEFKSPGEIRMGKRCVK